MKTYLKLKKKLIAVALSKNPSFSEDEVVQFVLSELRKKEAMTDHELDLHKQQTIEMYNNYLPSDY